MNKKETPEKETEKKVEEDVAEEKENKTDTSKKSKKKESKEDKLQKELDETKDKLLRVTAEYDNFRKRSAKEKESTFSNAKATVVTEFISVADNLSRAVENETDDIETLKKGLEMTNSQLNNAFEKLGVQTFGVVGETFDPNLHNAVMHIEDESLGEQEITDVFQQGFKINDKVIRPAMVKVAN